MRSVGRRRFGSSPSRHRQTQRENVARTGVNDDRGKGHQRRHAGRHPACRRRLSPGRAGQLPRAVRISAAQQGHPGARHRRHPAAAAGARAALVRPDRGGRHAPLHRQRLCPCDRATAGLRQVGRTLRRRGHRPLRHDRVDHAAALVGRQGRHGRHLRLRRRAVARRRPGPSGAESDLSLRRLQRLWRHVRLPRLQSGRGPAHLSLSARRLQHGSRVARSARRSFPTRKKSSGASP